MFTTVVAYALIVGFILIEGRLRQGQEAKSLKVRQSDQGSTKIVGRAFGVCLTVLVFAPPLNYLELGNLVDSTAVGAVGLVVMAMGLSLRYWANQTLGASYTRTLRVRADQALVDYGPYRWIRNPGYLGTLLLFTGAGLAVTNWIAFAIMAAALLAAYTYRIRAEESMLLAEFGNEYRAYMARSWKLVPLVY